MCLGRDSSILFGGISTFRYRKYYIKTGYNSKIFMNFTDFSCAIFFFFFGSKYANTLKSYITHIDGKSSTYVDFGVENYDKDPKF